MNSFYYSVMLSLTIPIQSRLFLCIHLICPNHLVLPQNTKLYVYLYFMSLPLYNPNLGVGIMPLYILHHFLCGVLDKGV